MTAKIFDCLPDEAYHIREEVFIKEQGFENELDDIDGVAVHIVMYDGEKPVATCRTFFDSGMESYIIGRVAVLREYRGRHIGAMIIAEAEKQIVKMGGKRSVLSSQQRAQDFYAKQGYSVFGELHYDEGCPHLWMEKALR